MRGTDFIRVTITDRCLTMYGKTYNLTTGHEWDFFPDYDDTEEEANRTRVLLSESLPNSYLQIGLLNRRE